MIRAAVTFAHKGLAVFPCRPQDKRPATADGLKDASKDLMSSASGGTPSRKPILPLLPVRYRTSS